MAQVNTCSCDECGTLKLKENGWWNGLITNGIIPTFKLFPFDSPLPEYKQWCGDTCALKAFNRFLAESKPS